MVDLDKLIQNYENRSKEITNEIAERRAQLKVREAELKYVEDFIGKLLLLKDEESK